MENQQQLVHTEQHSMNSRFYVIEVFKGQAFRNGTYEYRKTQTFYERIVRIKAFTILISEIIMVDGTPKKVLAASFPYCTSRTGEFMALVAEMKETCNSILDVEYLMERSRIRLNAALDRDAERALKRNLDIFKNTADIVVTSSTRDYPLPRNK